MEVSSLWKQQQEEMWRWTFQQSVLLSEWECRCRVGALWGGFMSLPLGAPLVICPIIMFHLEPSSVSWIFLLRLHAWKIKKEPNPFPPIVRNWAEARFTRISDDAHRRNRSLVNIRWHKNEQLIINSVKWVVQLLWTRQHSASLLTFATQLFQRSQIYI